MRTENRLYLALNNISNGFKHVDSRHVQCGSEHAFRLPMGKCSSDIEKRLESIMSAVGAPVELIDRGGVIVVRVIKKDYPEKLVFNSSHLLNDKLLIGYDRLFNPIYLKLMHLLMGGAANSGKTMMIRFLLYQLIRLGAIIKIIDMKGYSFLPFEGFSNVTVAKNITEAHGLMVDAAAEIEKRMNYILTNRDRSLTKSLPPYIVLIDEAGQIAPQTYPKGVFRNQAAFCDATCARIAQIGRESRVILFYCTQRPSRDIVNGQVKANVESMISFRVNNHYESEIILGEPGAERISPTTPGRCIYKFDRKYNVQVPFIGEEDEEWEALMASLQPEVISIGSSKRYEPQRISVEGTFESANSHNQAAILIQPIPKSTEESISNPSGNRKRKTGTKQIPPARKDMEPNTKRKATSTIYTDEIPD